MNVCGSRGAARAGVGLLDSIRAVEDDRVERYAALLLDTCLGVQPGWQVLVWGMPWARPLLEAVTRQIGRRGAYPLLRLTFGGGLVYHRDWLRHAPLDRSPAGADRVHALETCDALLAVVRAREHARRRRIAPERTARGAGRLPRATRV